MVENIYGRKTHPQYKNESALLQSYFLHHRKTSGEPASLRTILESEDVSSSHAGSSISHAVPTTTSSTFESTSTERKSRTVSLPAIYRDGSYLRINLPAKFNNDRVGRRRFSEPTVSWCSNVQPAVVSAPNPKQKLAKPVLAWKPNDSVDLGTYTETQAFQVEKRRHSDPLLYSREDESSSRGDQTVCATNTNAHDTRSLPVNSSKDFCQESDADSSGVHKSGDKAQASPNSMPTRRRKSSLVPIPFSVVKSSSRKKQAMPRWRFSFPLSKNEEGLTKTFPELRRNACNLSHIDYESSNESALPLDVVIDSLSEMDLPKEANSEENNSSCEEIITQWMKFFG